ncbi:uncharacterized protein LOC113272880 [Papaver somniferum]|uniref:uncharacterized protein LOC113272880 n=1 Tax=Papaver somniferum TaxID=3469 RepID=UPI000E6FB5AB|nr:uncharacterized protein LOC113272880 [Papaver somniferum]
MADNVTAEDIKNFYSDARVLYRRLAVDNARELVVCMEAIALWIFLEGMGFPNLVKKLLRTHDKVVNMIMDEASLCFGWLESITPPLPSANVSDMPLTQELMGGKPINSALVYRNRMDVLSKVNATVSESFAIAFDDIIREVSGMSFAELNVQPLLPDQHDARSFPYHYPQQAPCVVGKPLYGLKSTDGVDIAVYPVFTPSSLMFYGGSASSAPMNIPNHTPLAKEEYIPEIKRGIFFTFYRENPVQQRELENYLERSFGDRCIEKVTMQQVPENEKPLWASVVFCSEIPVLAIMQGRETAPMSINGKKVWAGKEWM